MADMLMLLVGEAMAPLLTRLYYNSGGNSLWMVTLAQSAGAPLLVIPFLLTPRAAAAAAAVGEPRPAPAASKMVAICVALGLVVGCDNLMYFYAMLYLPRFTPLVVNSVVVLTFSAALLGVDDPSSSDGGGAGGNAVRRGKHAVGVVLTLSASAVYALILSLFEATFDKVIGAATPQWVLKMQISTNAVAAAVSAAALFASGEWRAIRGEMAAFKDGKAAYAATVVGVAMGWQAAALGAVRLIARVSSLFANVTGTLALPMVPVLAVALFGDKMTGTKVVAMLMAVWGFLSYVYQHYLDGRRAAAREGRVHAAAGCVICTDQMTYSSMFGGAFSNCSFS
uniref:Probable purine permease n=1 Tax=Oryza meridionalis TaxID=40149 RepID=A0A0E0DWW3_9ORYZ